MATLGVQLLSPGLNWTRYDDRESRFVYSGTWVKNNYGGYNFLNNTVTESVVFNDSMTFSFVGRGIRILGYGNVDTSGISVTIDNKTYGEYKSCYGNAAGQVVLFEVDDLNINTHFCTIRVLNSSSFQSSTRTRILIDAIDIYKENESYGFYFRKGKDKIVSEITNNQVALRDTYSIDKISDINRFSDEIKLLNLYPMSYNNNIYSFQIPKIDQITWLDLSNFQLYKSVKFLFRSKSNNKIYTYTNGVVNKTLKEIGDVPVNKELFKQGFKYLGNFDLSKDEYELLVLDVVGKIVKEKIYCKPINKRNIDIFNTGIYAYVDGNSVIDGNILGYEKGARVTYVTVTYGCSQSFAINGGFIAIDDKSDFYNATNGWNVQGCLENNNEMNRCYLNHDNSIKSVHSSSAQYCGDRQLKIIIINPFKFNNQFGKIKKIIYTITNLSFASASSDGDVDYAELWYYNGDDIENASINPNLTGWTLLKTYNSGFPYMPNVLGDNVNFKCSLIMIKAKTNDKSYMELACIKALASNVEIINGNVLVSDLIDWNILGANYGRTISKTATSVRIYGGNEWCGAYLQYNKFFNLNDYSKITIEVTYKRDSTHYSSAYCSYFGIVGRGARRNLTNGNGDRYLVAQEKSFLLIFGNNYDTNTVTLVSYANGFSRWSSIDIQDISNGYDIMTKMVIDVSRKSVSTTIQGYGTTSYQVIPNFDTFASDCTFEINGNSYNPVDETFKDVKIIMER